MTTPASHVLVVGAGPIGLTHALILANAGVKVTVIERMLAPGDLPRAISLVDESFRILQPLGLADALKAETLLDTGSRYFGLNGRLLAAAKPVPSRIGHSAKNQFDQPVLEQLLFDRASEHPLVDLRLGREVTRFNERADSVEVHTRSVTTSLSPTHVDAEDETFTARWLVGADGGKSTVRDLAKIRLLGSTQTQRWIVIDLLNDTFEREKYADFHCDGLRPYVLVPGVQGRLRIEFMLFDHEDADGMTHPDKIRELVAPFRADLDPADVRRAAVYVAHQRVAAHYRQGRVFLIGDAAHLMPPFAGQGLNAGMRDAHNLAWKLAEDARGRARDRMLDTYESERRTHGAKMVRVSQRVGRVVMATGAVATRVRDLSVRTLCTIPPVRDFLSNMRFITPPDYSADLAIAPQGAQRNLQHAVGRAISQPTVRAADGEPQLLDTFLGTGWAIVTLPGTRSPEIPNLSAQWDALEPARVVVSHTSAAQLTAAPRSISVREVASANGSVSGSLQTLAGPETRFVLVRPDKYVCAVFDASQDDTVRTALSAFVSFGTVRDGSANGLASVNEL